MTTIRPLQLVMCVAYTSHTLCPFPRRMTKSILLFHVMMALVLLSYCLTVLLSLRPTVSLSYCLAVLLPHCPTVLPVFYFLAVLLSHCPGLLSYCITVLLCLAVLLSCGPSSPTVLLTHCPRGGFGGGGGAVSESQYKMQHY